MDVVAHSKERFDECGRMDVVAHSKERFYEVAVAMTAAMKRAAVPSDGVRFVPVCATTGANVASAPEQGSALSWHTGSYLTEALAAVALAAHANVDGTCKELRMPVQDVFRVSGVGTVVCGKIEAGSVIKGAMLLFAPSGVCAEVKSIEAHGASVEEGRPGDVVGISLRGVATGDVSRGCVALSAQASPPPPAQLAVESFQATVSVRRAGGVTPGYVALLCVHTAHVPCRISKVVSRLDKKTGKVAEDNPSSLGDKDVGTVELMPLRPLFLEERAVLGPLGRFVMQDHHQIVAFGAVKSVTRAPPVACKPGSLTGGAAGAAAEGA
ncbi:hypothetical protein FOA52_012356 [Chlamydomonas sp. UWO 241]|nr:hypothetical protein FOA52_012356 [Chlamydomonas sp. UWO 241]